MISIILVNYQKYEDTFTCVDSILESQTTEEYRIVIVDNASTNDSWEQLQKFKDNPKITLIQAAENNGYCAGNNIGIKYSIDNISPDYIWILNPDTLVTPTTMQVLSDYAKTKEDLGVLGCKLVYYPDTYHLQALGGGNFGLSPLGELRSKRPLYRMESSEKPLPKEVEVDIIIGASMFIPIGVFEKVGFLNEMFFLYADETEFCLRVLKAGFKNYAISEATVFHTDGYRQKTRSAYSEYYGNRNSLYLVRDLYPQNLRWNIVIYHLNTCYLLLKFKFKSVHYRTKAFKDFKNNVYGKVDL